MMQAQKKKPNSARTLFRRKKTKNLLNSREIMARNNRNFKQKEERVHPDSPDGLVVAAVNNKPFAERLINVFRLAKSRVKKDERR